MSLMATGAILGTRSISTSDPLSAEKSGGNVFNEVQYLVAEAPFIVVPGTGRSHGWHGRARRPALTGAFLAARGGRTTAHEPPSAILDSRTRAAYLHLKVARPLPAPTAARSPSWMH